MGWVFLLLLLLRTRVVGVRRFRWGWVLMGFPGCRGQPGSGLRWGYWARKRATLPGSRTVPPVGPTALTSWPKAACQQGARLVPRWLGCSLNKGWFAGGVLTGCAPRPELCHESASLLLERRRAEGSERVFYTALLSRSYPIPLFVKKALGIGL